MSDEKIRKLAEMAVKLHALLGSANAGEAETARLKLHKLSEANRKTWNDLPELLALGRESLEQKRNTKNANGSNDDKEYGPIVQTSPIPNIFDLIFYTLRHYLYFKSDHALTALTLWIMHTNVFDRFMITPRFALLGPTSGCGKTTAMTLLYRLAFKAERHDDPSAASLYQTIDFMRPTLLVDEVDNLGLNKPGPIRTLFYSGHHQDGSVTRAISGRPRRYSTFSPLAIAAIGSLPVPLLQRCVLIRMQRAPGRAGLRRLDTKNTAQMEDLDAIHGLIYRWSRECMLALDPPLPGKLLNRRADNWRVLTAVADACDRGDMAREAAIELSLQHRDEDIAIELLADIREVFDTHRGDRMRSVDLCAALHDLDDRPWIEWRGVNDTRAPRPLSPSELSTLLRRFEIAPRRLWPIGPRAGQKIARGYFRADFDSIWASYLDLADPEENEGSTPAKAPPLRLV
jgi:Protein of unknown function (DUF3631)